METAPLKSFATWARTSLIREVTARIAVVLAPASSERVEQPKAVEALQKAVTAAGGGDKGRAAVADKVAYTWFNRIVALRFMDANGYTGVGVVSPQAGVDTGQPEILAEAKRGNFETEVVGRKTRETVTGLLNGTRRSDDAQGEAYALQLADYCRYWNRAMPFMFEREGDFTELLIPANLLADDSAPSRAVKVLTKEVCQDVEVIGWLYQFYIAERKDEVFAGFKKNKKAGADEIPAATQLFTPHWIVRYLVENSLGRLWMLNRPASRLANQMQYYIAPVDEETDVLKISRPEELKVVDPACGSGHMLTYAFDLLYAIYEEEGYAPAEIPGLILTNNLYGVEIDPRAGALAAFALTMKARTKQRTFFNKQIEPNICVLDPIRFTQDEIDFLLTRGGHKRSEAAFWNQFEHADTLGSLIQPDQELTIRLKAHVAQLDDAGDMLLADVLDWAERVVLQAEYLSQRYHVAVTNPPYMGSGNMCVLLSDRVRSEFPSVKQDLYACFVVRSDELVLPGGRLAIVIGDTWLTIKTFEKFRGRLLEGHAMHSLVHLDDVSNHPDVFGANTAFVLERSGAPVSESVFIQLTPLGDEPKRLRFLEAVGDLRAPFRYAVRAERFAAIPGKPFTYTASNHDLELMASGPRVGDDLVTREGLTTGDNDRFLRLWHEVSYSRVGWSRDSRNTARWFPYIKGGEVRKWFGNLDFVVDWEGDGQRQRRNIDPGTGRIRSHNYNGEFAFRIGLTWSGLSSSHFAARFVPEGFMFDAKGPMGFASDLDRLLAMLALLNSASATRIMKMLAPTMDFKIGHVLNVPSRLTKAGISTLSESASIAVERARAIWSMDETAFGFQGIDTDADFVTVDNWAQKRHESLGSSLREIAAAQNTIDRVVRASYGWAVDAPEPGQDGYAREFASTPEAQSARDLVSFAVGCMFGRYSLDEPGLILADQGAMVQGYLAKVPNPTFAPDKDNVIPIVDGDWFEDDVVARFRSFLRVAFGEQHFEENLRFVTESLGVKDIRDYFVRSFYKDHVQRYKKRPIYWLFSSPRGSFNALIYMHRYTPSTVSTVLNEYLREFTAKLSSSLQQQERLAARGGTPRQQAAAQREADRLRKVLLELEEYEHDVLYPLASRQLAIDLDDGVKANYPKFGEALKKIPGFEASDE